MQKFYTNATLKKGRALVRGYQNSKRFQEEIDVEPYLFVPDKNGKFKTLEGRKVSRKDFSSISKVKEYVSSYEGVSPTPFYGSEQFLYQYINDEYVGETVDYDEKLISVVSIDIETMSTEGFPDPKDALFPVTMITISKNGKRLMFGLKPYEPKIDGVTYVMCRNETNLLESFIVALSSPEWDPDVITGWNIEGFDVVYLVNRIKRVLSDSAVKRLSPWRMVHEKEIQTSRGIEYRYDIVGISIIDYLPLYKKFSLKNQENYKLDTIAYVELGERKVDYSEYGTLNELYEKNFELYADYNLDDTIKIDKLEARLGFISQVFALAYSAKCNYSDMFATVKPWDTIITNYLLNEEATVVPWNDRDSSGRVNLIGGYVKDVVPGMYEDIGALDFTSLYPKVIITFNISPETLVKRLEDFPFLDDVVTHGLPADVREYAVSNDLCVAGNGCAFSRSKMGFLPRLMDRFFSDRDKYKKLKAENKRLFESTGDVKYKELAHRYDKLQGAKKVQLNSLYGALANEWFRFFSIDLAEAVTTSGRILTKRSILAVNSLFNSAAGTKDKDYVISADTDSMYITFSSFLNSEKMSNDELADSIDEICREVLGPHLKSKYEKIASEFNVRDLKIEIKREAIARRGIWRAKKMYVVDVLDDEGIRLSEPEIKVVGLEVVRSSTPQVVREKLKKSFEILLRKTENDLREFVAEFREDFMNRTFEDIASPSSVNGLDKYVMSKGQFKTGTPYHVKGALMYNYLLKKNGLENKYQTIYNGDKIRVMPLVSTCSYGGAIAAPDVLPPEFDLDRYVDKEHQFEKVFLTPLRSLTGLIGWKPEEQSSVLSCF